MAAQSASGNKSTGPWLVILAIVVVVIGGLLIWRKLHPAHETPASPLATAASSPAAAAATAIQHPVQAAPALAASAASGAPVALANPSPEQALDGLRSLFTGSRLDALLLSSDLAQRCVSTVDALPRQMVPLFSLPLRLPTGRFQVVPTATGPVLAASNAARYAMYLQLLEHADPKALVAWYVRHYALFQQAYRDLGYPHAYFNDRLVAVIDHLLAAPNPPAPLALQPAAPLYRYANPQLEALSAGQKWMMRLGPEAEARVKARLRLIRAQLVAVAPPAA